MNNDGIEICFPPSPNWYCARAISANRVRKEIAFASKNDVVILRYEGKDSPPSIVRILDSAHSEKSKVTTVIWNPSGQNDESRDLATCADDGNVKVWNSVTGELCARHDTHKVISQKAARHQSAQTVTCISWSPTDPSVIYSSDEAGNIVTWDIKLNTTMVHNLNKQTIYLLEAHPQNRHIVSYGCKSGLVFIVSLKGQGTVLHKLRGHDDEIQGLCWSPSLTEEGNLFFSIEDEDNFLLATSSKDRIVNIWSSVSGRSKLIFKIPGKSKASSNAWFTCHWISSTSLFTSGPSDALLWHLDKTSSNKKPVCETLHSLHARACFSFASLSPQSLLSVGQDRFIVCYDLETKTPDFILPTFTYAVYCIVSHPVDNSILAIGGEQIRIWRSDRNLDVKNIWQRFKGAKIHSLAWHPTSEGTLAFGTDEGRVGVVDALASNPQPVIYDYQHKFPVYNLSWGLRINDEKTSAAPSKYVLYSIGGGNIVIHESAQNSRILENQGNISRSDMTFNPKNNSVVVVGLEDGTVELRNVHSFDTVRAVIKSHQKLIQCLAWHPTDYSFGESNYVNWLAVASNENHITVWDLQSLINVDNEEEKRVLTSPTVTLKGHFSRIIQVAWSPHEEDRLLSVSYDLSAQVWNAIKGEPLANFRGHNGRVFCGIWSPTNPEVIYTGGYDSTLFGWNYTKQPEKIPVKRDRKKLCNRRVEVESDVTSNNNNNNQNSEDVEVIEETDEKLAKPLNDNGKTRFGARSQKSYFPMAHQLESQFASAEECLLIDDSIHGTSDSIIFQDPNKVHLRYFINKEENSEFNIAEPEISHLKSQGLYEHASVVQLWSSGEMGTAIREAMTNGRLNDWLISMASMTGFKLWKEACEVYAEQLIKLHSDYVKASTYYLMAQKPLMAIEALKTGGLFRAAISIAKGRLNGDEEILKDLYVAWAKQSTQDGRYLLGSRCFAAGGNRLAAANVLSKVPDDPECLRVAGILLSREEEIERAEVVASLAANLYLQKHDFIKLQSLVDEPWTEKFGIFRNYYVPLVIAHSEMNAKFEQPVEFWNENENKEESTSDSLIKDIRSRLSEKLEFRLTQDELEPAYSSFLLHCSSSEPAIIIKQELILCSLSLYDKQKSLLHFTNALQESCSTQNPLENARLIHSILPRGANADPPEVGMRLWDEPLDWQCRWQELQSLQCYAAYSRLKYLKTLKKDDLSDIEYDVIVELADSLMLEDVIHSQKLLYEIKEAELALKEYDAEGGEDNVINLESLTLNSEEPPVEQMGSLSIEESPKRATQTMQLGEDGEWKTVLADSIPQPTDPSMPAMPPPMGLVKSFKERFLSVRSESTKINALKELQRLKWVQSRTNVLTTPYPDLTEALKETLDFLHDVKEARKRSQQKKDVTKLKAKSKDIATWCYWKAATKEQRYFLELT